MADAAQPSRPGLAALYLAKLTASRGSGFELPAPGALSVAA
jgi:hypothetical protein